MADKTLFVIGFGAVGQAWLRFVKHVNSKGLLKGVRKIRYFAPEIKEHKDEGLFEFNNAPFVTRETLVPLLNTVSAPAPPSPVSLRPCHPSPFPNSPPAPPPSPPLPPPLPPPPLFRWPPRRATL
jgi:hypothetical protein